MSFGGGVGGTKSCGGSENEGSGLPGFSSHMNGTEAISLTGGFGTGLTEEAAPGFQSLLGIPGLTSQRNGTEGGCLSCFEFEFPINSFSIILELNLCPYRSSICTIYIEK